MRSEDCHVGFGSFGQGELGERVREGGEEGLNVGKGGAGGNRQERQAERRVAGGNLCKWGFRSVSKLRL